MKGFKIFYKRHLPHYQPSGYTYFITFRLVNSLPSNIVLDLRMDYERSLKNISEIKDKKIKSAKYEEIKMVYFENFDSCLHENQNNICWLKKTEIANIVKDSIHFRDNKDLYLIAYTIMPNHVHLIFRLNDEKEFKGTEIIKEEQLTVGEHTCSPYRVTNILKSLKWYTAVESNKILNRSGPFWQHESYDHVIRSEEELIDIIEYVLLNPVKAGLVENWEDWQWNYCNFENL